MPDPEEKLHQLQTRLDNLAKYEAAFKREIADIRREIELLKSGADVKPDSGIIRPRKQVTIKPVAAPRVAPKPESGAPSKKTAPVSGPSTTHPNVERFVGTYLISIIGVLITVIGVGIGAKYAIDNNLISPVFRIVFGYTVGVLLALFALKLKAKYETFSAVLLSGGMAILYFITYFAYGFYDLIPQILAFVLMVALTITAVMSAISYNRAVIANIGLVGAYAVPFLLSDDSGRAAVLFTYIAIINIGILAVSISKYWKSLFYLAFFATWVIFASWFAERYQYDQHFGVGFTSITIFFFTFYLCFLLYKLIHKKPLGIENVGLVLTNSFAFFGFGYAILDTLAWKEYLGLFTISNAAVHFAVAFIIHKYKLGDRNAFYLAAVLVLVFVTLAVPVQADGHSITILWMAEAAFLFIIGRWKKVALFEYLSYPLMFLASISLLDLWNTGGIQPRYGFEPATPIFNRVFVTSLFSTLCFGAIFYVNRLVEHRPNISDEFFGVIRYVFPCVFGLFLYLTFLLEIAVYFNYREIKTAIETDFSFSDLGSLRNISLSHLMTVSQLIYSMLFAALLSYLNLKRIKNPVLLTINLAIAFVLVFFFLTFGLIALGELRELYVSQADAGSFYRGILLVLVRYVSFACLGGMIWTAYREIFQEYLSDKLPHKLLSGAFELGICFTIWAVLSNELYTWLEVYKTEDPFKLGLSILWAIIALALIVVGIARRQKHIRVFAITLLGTTLLKLFLYDMYDLETIPKTILFLSIGVLLLIASFLYNKYTKLIFDEAAKK